MFIYGTRSDTVGLDDLVLLEDYKNENEFIKNLQKRHEADIIYVISLSEIMGLREFLDNCRLIISRTYIIQKYFQNILTVKFFFRRTFFLMFFVLF